MKKINNLIHVYLNVLLTKYKDFSDYKMKYILNPTDLASKRTGWGHLLFCGFNIYLILFWCKCHDYSVISYSNVVIVSMPLTFICIFCYLLKYHNHNLTHTAGSVSMRMFLQGFTTTVFVTGGRPLSVNFTSVYRLCASGLGHQLIYVPSLSSIEAWPNFFLEESQIWITVPIVIT